MRNDKPLSALKHERPMTAAAFKRMHANRKAQERAATAVNVRSSIGEGGTMATAKDKANLRQQWHKRDPNVGQWHKPHHMDGSTIRKNARTSHSMVQL